jgi:hypothetical protein
MQIAARGAVLLAVGAFALSVAALHGLRPDVSPLRSGLSAYSIGPYAWLMQGAYLALALAFLLSAVVLRLSAQPCRALRVGRLSLLLASLGLLITARSPSVGLLANSIFALTRIRTTKRAPRLPQARPLHPTSQEEVTPHNWRVANPSLRRTNPRRSPGTCR